MSIDSWCACSARSAANAGSVLLRAEGRGSADLLGKNRQSLTTARPVGRRPSAAAAAAGECGQCHVVSWRRKLNPNLFLNYAVFRQRETDRQTNGVQNVTACQLLAEMATSKFCRLIQYNRPFAAAIPSNARRQQQTAAFVLSVYWTSNASSGGSTVAPKTTSAFY